MSELDHVEEYCRALGETDPDARGQFVLVASGGLCAPASGTYVHLGGGTLDLGVVRDSVSNFRQNDFAVFRENFE